MFDEDRFTNKINLFHKERYGEMMNTLFMSYIARDNILINIHQLKLSPFDPPPTYYFPIIEYSLTYQIIFKKIKSLQNKLNQLNFVLE